MKKQICVCDHCGAEFNPVNGFSDIGLDDLTFDKEIDLCMDCYNELCDMVEQFVPRIRE